MKLSSSTTLSIAALTALLIGALVLLSHPDRGDQRAAETVAFGDERPANAPDSLTGPPPTDGNQVSAQGVSARWDQDCTIEEVTILEAEGSTSTAYQCIPTVPAPSHPYASYDTDVLREMAYNDSEAAEILAVRLIGAGHEEEGLQYVYRAVALTGGESMNAIIRAHNSFYAEREHFSEESGLITPATEAMEQAYVFDRIRDSINGSTHSVYTREQMTSYGYEGDFEALESEAYAALKAMSEIERDVVGTDSIQEKVDA